MKRPFLLAVIPVVAFVLGWAYGVTERESPKATDAYLRAAYDREAELRTVILLQRVQLQRSRLAECGEGVR